MQDELKWLQCDALGSLGSLMLAGCTDGHRQQASDARPLDTWGLFCHNKGRSFKEKGGRDAQRIHIHDCIED